MAYSNRAFFENLRSESTIGATYTAVGAAYTNPLVVVCFKNNTDGDVLISTDGVNDMLVLPATSYSVYDIRTNSPNESDLMLPVNIQFYVKDGTTPSTTGSLYIEAVSVRQFP